MAIPISMMRVHSGVRVRVGDRVMVRLSLGIGIRMELGLGLGLEVHNALFILLPSHFNSKLGVPKSQDPDVMA